MFPHQLKLGASIMNANWVEVRYLPGDQYARFVTCSHMSTGMKYQIASSNAITIGAAKVNQSLKAVPMPRFDRSRMKPKPATQKPEKPSTPPL